MSDHFKRFQIDMLEQLVEQHQNEHTILKQIDTELSGRRTRQRNTQLRAKIQRILLSSKAKDSSGGHGNRKDAYFDNRKSVKSTNSTIESPKRIHEVLETSFANEISNVQLKSKFMNSGKLHQYPANFLASDFKHMRDKLLDISGGRSRLLNVDPNGKSFIRIVDELPDSLAKLLLSDKTMKITPVPEPSLDELIEHGYLEWDEEEKKHTQHKKDPDAKEWAGVIGIDNKYDLPESDVEVSDDRHVDLNIQVMQFEAKLNRLAKKLRTDARTAIEETGNNILYLCIGFLEWIDKVGSQSKRYAPLYLIPINIMKESRKGIEVHTIKYTGEDLIQNLILREKLQRDFGLTLPDIYDSDNEDRLLEPEEYFHEVDSLLKRKGNDPTIGKWKVRRFATLATLSLGKLLMYRDLDPKNWPQGEGNILEHNVIRQFFFDGEQEAISATNQESYVLDEVPELHDKYPMIEDADSSQMSVVIDVIKGKNLVVEGPPGTGKSQTITNIISAAISQGKTVLFVAEKRAALQVVKRRMDKAGLGDFCLDLHSDKAQKRIVLDSFKERIFDQATFNCPESEYVMLSERYERAREKLKNYVCLINQQWKNTGLTIHEILMAATRYASEVSPLSFKKIEPENVHGDNFTKVKLDEKLEQLQVFYEYLDIASKQLPEAGQWDSHPWFGVGNKELAGVSPEHVIDTLKVWNSSLSDCLNNISEQCELVGLEFSGNEDKGSVEALVNAWASVPVPKNEINYTGIRRISINDVETIKQYIQRHFDLAESYRLATSIFAKEVIYNPDLVERIDSSLSGLVELGVDESLSFNSLARELVELEKCIEIFSRIEKVYRESVPHLPDGLSSKIKCDLAGLKEFSTFVSLASKLPKQYVNYRDKIFDNEEISEHISDLVSLQNELLSQQKIFEAKIVLEDIPERTVLKAYITLLRESGAFSWLKSSWRQAKKSIIAFTKLEKFDPQQIADLLEEFLEWSSKCEQFTNDRKSHRLLKDYFEGLHTDFDLVSTVSSWYKQVRTEYGIGFGQRVAFANVLSTMPDDVFLGVQRLNEIGVVDDIQEFQRLLNKQVLVFKNIPSFKHTDIDLAAEDHPLSLAHEQIETRLRNCQQYLINANLPQQDLKEQIRKFNTLRTLKSQIEQSPINEDFFGNELHLEPLETGEIPKDIQVIKSSIDFVQELYDSCPNEQITVCVRQKSSRDEIVDFRAVGESLDIKLALVLANEAKFFELVDSQLETWCQHCGFGGKAILARNQNAIDNGPWLDSWTKYLFARARMEHGGFHQLNKYLSQKIPTLEFAENAMKFATYYALAQEIYQELPELSQMSGHEQTAVQEQFAKLDEQLKILQRRRIASIVAKRPIPAGTRGARVANYTGDALLQREMEKKTRHISIRNLVSRAGDAMVAYKPCFMMSPMAVAKYIAPGALNFDIVVMDEASQVKPEDALSCFARGKQVVVVGDSKQLPPTSFFDKSTSNDASIDEEETGVIEESESILEAVTNYFEKRQLKWHYRSRHESLIEFSNHRFYNSNLVVFPSPWDQSDEYGIKFHYVDNGRFINNVNQTESNVVIAAIKDHLISKPDESLGVVAMNTKQRDLIESNLESALGQDPVFASAYDRNLGSEDPLFIKNLENVQGDERDVIFISFTYGPQEKGSSQVPQRFGPINGPSGWRRLNVLFTRAKKRVQVYSSMYAEQIVINETSSLGVKSLKGYLEFARTGRLIGQDGVKQREPDSDFEIAVIDVLSRHGFECAPQVGVAGFFIDLAVRDPGMPGRYLMGIECDGASYHSDKSTRDRDRVRQGVLEGLGWKIRRIWSTDWFKNPDAEIKPIINELKELSSPIDAANEIMDASVEQEQLVPESGINDEVRAAHSLKEALMRYAKDVIEKKYPNTDISRRLLRPDMIERLISEEPLTEEDFLSDIPAYLRTNTSTQEANDFLSDVIEIVNDYASTRETYIADAVAH